MGFIWSWKVKEKKPLSLRFGEPKEYQGKSGDNWQLSGEMIFSYFRQGKYFILIMVEVLKSFYCSFKVCHFLRLSYTL